MLIILQNAALVPPFPSQGFLESLLPVTRLYESMHDLPVVQKRVRCREMTGIRDVLMREEWFVQILKALGTLRQHLYTCSKKVLLLGQLVSLLKYMYPALPFIRLQLCYVCGTFPNLTRAMPDEDHL